MNRCIVFLQTGAYPLVISVNNICVEKVPEEFGNTFHIYISFDKR